MVLKNGDYVEGQQRKLRKEERPTDAETIEAQRNTIKQLQEFIEFLPSWSYVNKLKETIAGLRVIIAQLQN